MPVTVVYCWNNEKLILDMCNYDNITAITALIVDVIIIIIGIVAEQLRMRVKGASAPAVG